MSVETMSSLGPPFVRNSELMKHRFDNNPTFLKALQDPGAGFTHPLKANLVLEDFFVYPDLKLRGVETHLNRGTPRSVSGNNVHSWVAEKQRVVIAGPDDSGKTALARMLYSDLQLRHGRVPLLLDGSALKGNNPVAVLSRAVNSAVIHQYSEAVLPKFLQEPVSDKALVVDNWHKSGFSKAGRNKFIEAACLRFGIVALLVSDLFTIEEVAASNQDSPLAAFEHCDIRELGYVLRSRLIRKWHMLGREYSVDEKCLTQTVIESENLVNTLIGKNLLPAFPVTVFPILQTAEAYSKATNTATGSYGQLYEALITAALAQVSKKSVRPRH